MVRYTHLPDLRICTVYTGRALYTFYLMPGSCGDTLRWPHSKGRNIL